MKNFATLAILATLAFAAADEQRETEPVEPDMSAFPADWTEAQCSADDYQCKSDAANTADKSVEEVSRYAEDLSNDYQRCRVNQFCYPRRAYCKLQYNPNYPTTYPSGNINLWEFAASDDLFIWGIVWNLPYANHRYAFQIHEKRWDGRDCCSAGKILQTPSQTHGNPNNGWGHQIGNLWPILSNGANWRWFFQSAQKPTFWGTPFNPSIYYKTMVLWEDPDDFGFGGTWHSSEYGSAGQRIACCEIRPYRIIWEHAEVQDVDVKQDYQFESVDGRGRRLDDELEEDVDVFTVAEYRELFGHEPEQFASEMNFDQN